MSIFPKTLGVFSQYFWTRELVAANAIVFWADLNGKVDEQKLRLSLAIVQSKYPLLRAEVEKGLGQMPTFVEHQTTIDLRIAKPEEEREVARVIETEMDKGSDHSLFRVVLLRQGPEKATLIFVANHAITDARGLSFILRDLLLTMSDMPIGPPVTAIVTHEDLFDEPTLRNYVQALPCSETPYPADATKVKSQRTVVAATAVLSPNVVGALLERTRVERTTIQGALMAALLIAARELHPQWSDGRTLQMLVPVDLRRFHFGEESTDLLAYPALVALCLDSSMNFWELARTYRELLINLVTFEAGRTFVQQSKQLLSVEWVPQIFLDTTNRSFPHDLFMSNLGSVAIPIQYGHLCVEKVGFCTVSGPGSTQSICASTFQGWMYLSQLSQEPFSGLLRMMSRLLIDACS